MNRFLRTVLLPPLICCALAPAVPAQPGTLELHIDCDRGDSLARALLRAERVGAATLHVSGTCIGTLVVNSSNYIEILGDPGGGTVLQAGPGPVVVAAGQGVLVVNDVRMVGGTGVQASGDLRVVALTDCEIESESLGVYAESGAGVLVVRSDIRALDTAVLVADAQLVAQESRLHDSTFGARAFRGELWLDRVEVAGNSVGVSAENRSWLVALGAGFSENGQAHLGGTDDSRVQLYNAQIGGPADGTALSLYGQGGVSIEVYADDPAVDAWGGVNLLDDSFLSLEGTTLHGSIQARGFSRVLLDGTVDDGIGCGSAADAWCGTNASATTNGCPSAPQLCTPSSDRSDLPGPPRILPTPPRLLPDDRRDGRSGATPSAPPPVRVQRR